MFPGCNAVSGKKINKMLSAQPPATIETPIQTPVQTLKSNLYFANYALQHVRVQT